METEKSLFLFLRKRDDDTKNKTNLPISLFAFMYINRYQRYCSKIIGDMAISTSLKDRKVRGGLLFLVLILLPLSLLFASWLTNLWNFDDFLFSPPINTDDELSYDEHIADIEQQLKNVKCPARAGLELKDYWECLWRTSITANGLQTHRDHFAEEIVNKASEKWVSNSRRSKRVKRTENTWVSLFVTFQKKH